MTSGRLLGTLGGYAVGITIALLIAQYALGDDDALVGGLLGFWVPMLCGVAGYHLGATHDDA